MERNVDTETLKFKNDHFCNLKLISTARFPSFLLSVATARDHTLGLERRLTGKATASPSISALSSPQQIGTMSTSLQTLL